MTRKRSSPMGLEIYLSAMLAFIMLPLLVQAAPLQDYTEIQQYTEGCYYNYNHYNEGDRILTNEPCLNCTCHNKMLMCYLRVCPFTKPIGHDCIVEKREDQCCPIITCPEVPVDVAHSAPEPGTELSFPEKFGCSIDGKFYLEGAQVPSNPNKPCELCYCIKNRTSCLMQECTLHIDGCTPIYNKGSCCPVRYNCDHENDVLELEDHSTTTEAAATTTTERPTTGFIITSTMTPAVSTDCVHNGEMYADGARIAGETACENCYCMRGDIICAVQECHMPMLAGNGKSCHALPAAEGECCPSNYVCEDDTATTQIIEATTLPYAGLDEEGKITTSAPVKDLHSAIPEEDLQLQTHIDEEETATKISSADEGEEVTESATDIKPTGVPSAEEEPKEQDQETVTKITAEAETVTTTDAKAIEEEEIVTKATISADELHETITEAIPDAEKEGKPEDTDETVTKAPTAEEGKEKQPADVTVASEEASSKSPIAADEVPEISTDSTTTDDGFVTKAPLAEEQPLGVTEVSQEEDKPETIVTTTPMVHGVVSELATESPKEESEESTESVEEEIKPVVGDESVTKSPIASEKDVSSEASKEKQEPIETDESITKTPIEQTTQAVEGGKPEEEQDKFVTKTPIVGDEEQDEIVTKAPIASDEEQDEIVTKAPIVGVEEQDEIVTKAPTAESEGQDEIATKVPIAGDEEQDEIVTEAPIAGDDQQDEIITKTPIASDEDQEEIVTKAPTAGDKEQNEVVTKAPTLAIEEQDEDITKAPVESVKEPEVSTEASDEETEELSTRTPSTKDEEKPEAGEEEQDGSTKATIIEDEITSATAAPTKTISGTEGPKEDGKPVETEEQQPEVATKVPATDKEEQEISTESADEAIPTLADGLSTTAPSIKEEEETTKSTETPAKSEEGDSKATEGPSAADEDKATKAPKIDEEEPTAGEVFTKAPVSADEDQEAFTESAEASGEGKPISTDDQSIDISTLPAEEHKPMSADELGSGDYSTESSDEETSKPSSISSSTEGVTSAPQKEQEEDISTDKPIMPSEKKPNEDKVHEKEETSTMDVFEESVEPDEDQETVDVTTVKSSVTTSVTPESGEVPEEEKETATKLTSEVEEDISATTVKSETPVEHTTTSINADFTTITTADEEKVEGALSPSGEAEDKIDTTTMAASVNKEQLSEQQQPIAEHNNELPEEIELTTHVSVETSSIPAVEKESSEEQISGEEEKTKPDSEESVEPEEVTTQRAIDEAAQPTTVAPAIEIITESEDDQHKVIPESDDHKAEEPTEITDSPMVIIEDMSAFTTPTSTVDEDTKTETDAEKEQEVESTTLIPAVETQKEKLPSLDTRGDLDEGVPATTVKAVTEESLSVEDIPVMQLPSVIPGEGDCLVGQKTYGNNTIVPTSDECEITCKCISSIVTCERVKCEVPENGEQCTLDEASTNKCCPSYICGSDSMPSKTDDSAESVEDDEDEEIEFTTLAAPHKESKDKTEQTTFKPAVAPEQSSTVLSIPDIEMPIASTEQPMSHVKDDEEIEEQPTESPAVVMAEDKKDIVADSEISTTPAVAVEDTIIPQSMTPVETSEKETDQDISTEKTSPDVAQESSPELPVAQEQPELEFHKTTTAPVIDSFTDSSEQPSIQEDEHKEMFATTGAPSADEYQTVKPIDKKEDEEEETSDEIMAHTDKPIINQDEIKTPPAVEKETEPGTQTTVPTSSSEEEEKETQTATSVEKETSEKPETHTDIPFVFSEEEDSETSEEPEVHTGIPSVSSEEEETKTITPVDTRKEHPETQTPAPVAADEIQTIPPTGEKQEEPIHETEASTATPVAAEPHSEGPLTDIELQTIAPESEEKESSSTEESVEDISTGGTTVAPIKDEEYIERSTAIPTASDTQEQSSTAAPKQPVDVSDESIEPLGHTFVPSAEQPEFTSTVASISEDEKEDHVDTISSEESGEEDSSTTTITPVSKVEKEDDAEIHTVAPVTEDEDKKSALPTKEEKPVEQGIEGTTTAPATQETSKTDVYEDTSTKSVTPLGDESLEHTLTPIVLDETKETTDDTVAPTSPSVVSSDMETTSESTESEEEPETQTTIPSEESAEKDKETATAPIVNEDMAAPTTDSSVEGAYKEPTDMATGKPIDTSSEGTDKETTDMATDKPVDFETKIDTSTEDADVPTIAPAEDIVEDISNTTTTPVKKDEKESTEESIESSSVEEEEEPTVTMLPTVEETADITTPVHDGIRKITTVSSVENGESAEAFETTSTPLKKVTEASEEEEKVTVPSIKQEQDKLEPSMAAPVDEKEIEEDRTAVPVTDDQESVTSAPVAFDEHVPEEGIESITTGPVASDGSTSKGVSSEEELTDKIDMAPVKEDEIVPVSMSDIPVSPVEGFTTVVPVVEGEAQSTIAPAKKPSLDLSEEESGESVESEEEISSEPPKIQHIGEFVTDRIEEVTAAPNVQSPTQEKEGEKEASGQEPEDVEPATNVPQLPAVEQGDEITITTAAPAKTTEEPDYIEVTSDKLPEEGEDVVPTITKSPTDEEESTPAVTKSPISDEDIEDVTAQLPEEQDNVASVTKSPVAAEYVTVQQIEQKEAEVIPSVTNAPITAEDIESVTTQEPEEQDIIPSVTKAPISAEDIESVTTQQSEEEEEEEVLSVTKAPISAEDAEGVTAEHPEKDVTPVTKAPVSDEDVEGITAKQPEKEIVPSVTEAPVSAEDIGGITAQQPEEEVTMAPILSENVEGITPQQPEEEIILSVTKAPASAEDIEDVTAKQPEDAVASVTKAPVSAEDTKGSTAKQPEDVVPSVTKAPVSAEDDEGVTAQQSEGDAVPSVTKAPFADEDVESVTAQRPKDEDVSAVTKATVAPEDIDIATAKQPEEDISAVTKAPAAAEDVDTSTVQPPKEESEVVDDTKAPETSEETVTATDKLPTQQSDEITEATVTQLPSSDSKEDIVTEVPLETEIIEDVTAQKPEDQEEDVAPTVTKAPQIAEDVTSQQPEQHAVTKAPMSAEDEEDIDTATGKPSEDEQEVVSTVTTAPAAAEDIDMATAQPSREEEAIGVTKPPQTPEEIEATTSKLPTQQADEITEAAVTQVPITDVDDNMAKSPEEADKETSDTTEKLPELVEHTTELPTKDTEEQKEVTELPVVAHEASTVGQTVDQSTESATKAGEEESSEETYTEAVEEDRLQPTTTVHPLFPHITTMPSVAIDSRIDDTNATTIVPVKNVENEQEEDFTTPQTSSSTSTTSAPITTSAPHYQPQPPVYGQSPQYGPTQYEDEYTDEDEGEVFGPGTCRYGGKLYVSAQQIPRDDPCDFCFCFRSDIICLQQSCPPPIAGCHEEPISGFCCPRYECPVSMATVLNITTSTTTTSTTLPPHFLHHSYGNNVQRNGCLINGRSYRVGEKIESTSGPCINCTCGGDGKMKCDPQACVPEPTMQQVMAVVAAGRKR